MGMLPTARVATVFTLRSGLCGSCNFTQRKAAKCARNKKTYICVFVCFAKAIHIELISDLTSGTFLMSLKFISRRMPVSMHSDNGTTFVGASRQLSEIYEFLKTSKLQEEIKHFRKSEITWNFVSPHCFIPCTTF